MYFMHSDTIWSNFPSLRATVIVVGGVRKVRSDSVLTQPLVAAIEERLALRSEAEMVEIASWRDAFAKMGMKPTQYRCASEALLRRFRKERTLPSFHPLIDYLNSVSMKFAIPIAAFDIDQISEGITVRLAAGSETYQTFQGEMELPNPGEVIFADVAGNAHSRRWTHRQSAKSVVTADTDRVLIVSEALHEGAQRDLLALDAEVRLGLTQMSAQVVTSMSVDATRRRLEFQVP
jgi:DNA/RNA-binding domain of Phe-tRNA-synthetase-like protein